MKSTTLARAIAIVAMLAIASAAGAQTAAAPSENVNPAVLKVNDELIYAAEISMAMANIASQLSSQGEKPNQEQVVQMATQRVVEQKLLAQEARRQGLQPNELRVAEMMQALEEQVGGSANLSKSLTERGSNLEQMQGTLEEMDLARGLIERKIVPTIKVTDEELAAYYAENQDTFNHDDQVHARHIIFFAPEETTVQIVVDQRGKADEARRRALAGEDFGDLVKELSEDPAAAENGGDVGFFSYPQMVPTFAAAAFATEPGGISEVVRTEFGFHVINVIEKRPAGTIPLDEVSDDLRLMIGQRRTGEAVAALIKSLAEAATVTPLLAQPGAAPAAPQGGGQ